MINRFSLILMLIPVIVHGQNQLGISLDASASTTFLQNKSDQQSGLVNRTLATKPGAGITISYLNREKKGFQGLSLGVAYAQYYQSTDATSDNKDYPNTGVSHTDLRYLRIPLEARFGLGVLKKKWEPYVCAGLYAGFLLKYEEYFFTIYQDQFASSQEVTVKGNLMRDESNDRNGGGGMAIIELSKGLYHTFDWGAQLAIGTDYRINKHLFAGLRIQASYGFPDIERKGKIDYADANNTPYIRYPEDSFWDYNTPKATRNFVNRSTRSATHILVTGLQLSVGYNF